MQWFTKILDNAAAELAALDAGEYRQWVSYLFESIEAHAKEDDTAWRMTEARQVLAERIEQGRW